MSDTDQVLESVAAAEPNEPVITETTEAPEEVAVMPEAVFDVFNLASGSKTFA